MPNWCFTDIVFENEKDAEEVRGLVSTERSEFDFDALVPMPESLRIGTGGIEKIALGYFRGELSAEEAEGHLPCHVRSSWDEEPDVRTLDDLRALGGLYQANLDLYGVSNWYDWSCEKWGVKWNADCASWGESVVAFRTPWAPPRPVLEALAARFPEKPFYAVFAEEQFDWYTGIMFAAGDGSFRWHYPEQGSRDAFVIASYHFDPYQEDARWGSSEIVYQGYVDDAEFSSLAVLDTAEEIEAIVGRLAEQSAQR